MEDLLLNIVKEATGSKLQNLKQAAQIAHGNKNLNIFMNIIFNEKFVFNNIADKLFRQHGTYRDASHELRSLV